MANDTGARIGFRSAGEWGAADCTSFFDSVSGIYDALLVPLIRRRLDDAYLETLERSLRRMEGFGPVSHEYFMLWREMIHTWRKRGLPGMAPPLPLLPSVGTGHMTGRQLSAFAIYRDMSSYAPVADRLRVHRVHMASPGGFSLIGIDGIINQLRELIKDICWRNRHERVRGELEIISEYLRIRRENSETDLPPLVYDPADARLVKKVAEHIRNLRALEDSKQLEALAENLDYLPPD